MSGQQNRRGDATQENPSDIAVIGMAGRFPKAPDLETFWHNLINGIEGLRELTDEELAAVEPDYASLKNEPDYVPATGVLDGAELFDAEFFGVTPHEAASIDPQQRMWLEAAWQCLEHAGYAPAKYPGAIGVFTGSFMNSYLLYNLSPTRDSIEKLVRLHGAESFIHMINNERDYLPSRTSYLLNLRGPAINVQTACSTSLVAVSLASQSLHNYESDMALAGGVCLFLPQERGYVYQEGGMRSADGHCRPFDAKASGTVFASGLGVVLLKRMSDAVADRDNILAVIKGTALNNDGTHKASYTAPSVDGQAQVIAMAQAMADVEADSISYVEAHGTATPLGDPIEVAALTKAFRRKTDKNQFCALGAVKSNIGHLDAASGVAGLIKTILALQNEQIPPTLHYEKANPEIDFANTPFFVVDEATPWPRGEKPRRAGISSFGVGGTNAHAIVEEAPLRAAGGPSRSRQLLMLSARIEAALTTQAEQLATRLEADDLELPDVAFTLNAGRSDHNHRRVLVADGSESAASMLRDARAGAARVLESSEPSVVFLFPGQGSQFVEMGLELYREEAVYRDAIDSCSEILEGLLKIDLREVIYPSDENAGRAAETLKATGLAQPAIFAVSYALARQWLAWGVSPQAMVGHSVGEFAAATIAEVVSLEDALTVIAHRAQMMQALPGGSMRAVNLAPEALEPYWVDGISLAAHNAPKLCVVSGPDDAIADFDAKLAADDLDSIELHTSHAFHSGMMDPILEPFREIVSRATFKRPQIPMVSTVTGGWLTEQQATDPDYWVRQLRQPVLFAPAIRTLLEEAPERVGLEVGPGNALCTATRQNIDPDAPVELIDSLGHSKASRPALEATLEALGRLWMSGAEIDWDAFWGAETRRRVALPSYPFERKRHWVDPPALSSQASGQETAVESDDLEAVVTASNQSAPTSQSLPTSQAEEVVRNQLRLMKRQLELLRKMREQ